MTARPTRAHSGTTRDPRGSRGTRRRGRHPVLAARPPLVTAVPAAFLVALVVLVIAPDKAHGVASRVGARPDATLVSTRTTVALTAGWMPSRSSVTAGSVRR